MYALTVQALRRQLREQRSMTVNQLGIYSRDYRSGVGGGGGGLRRLEPVWNTGSSGSGTHSSGSGTHVETLFGSTASDLASPVSAPRRCGERDCAPKPCRTPAGPQGTERKERREKRWCRTPAAGQARRTALQGTDRGRRAVRVLGILFAVFVMFYLPFFAAYLVHGTCQRCQPYISSRTLAAFEWLQYSGSMLNPIVYHVFNPDFRRAFLKILRCRASL